MSRKPIAESKISIVGVARNVEKTVENDVRRLEEATKGFRDRAWFVVESDSSDATLKSLQTLKMASDAFNYVTLGRLEGSLEKRTERIAKCRNTYVEAVRKDAGLNDADYVLVADFDGVNNRVNAHALETCWSTDVPWDVCTANQVDLYYDVWALRHPDWCADDCWQQRERLLPLVGAAQAADMAIYSKMIHLDPDNELIEVESAFGGLAVYRTEAFLAGSYSGVNSNGDQICEHVPFHQQIREAGFRVYINPALINAGNVDHASQRKTAARIGLRNLCGSWIYGARYYTARLAKRYSRSGK
jgi:hypothetical protein